MSLELLQNIWQKMYSELLQNIWQKMYSELLQNISLYLAENVFKIAAKYQLISGRKCIQNCCKITSHKWQKKCLELLQIISLYLAENVLRIAAKYQLISGKNCEKPSKGFDKRPKNLNATEEKALRRPYWIRRITLKMAKYVFARLSWTPK